MDPLALAGVLILDPLQGGIGQVDPGKKHTGQLARGEFRLGFRAGVEVDPKISHNVHGRDVGQPVSVQVGDRDRDRHAGIGNRSARGQHRQGPPFSRKRPGGIHPAP